MHTATIVAMFVLNEEPETTPFDSHSAYPTNADLNREADAEEPDVADLVALRELRGIVAIAGAGRIDRIQHPDRRWTTADQL